MNVNGASNGKLTSWIAGAIVAPGMLAVFGFLAKTTIDNNSRISALERDTEHRLRSIEHKLDRILEGRP
jgi:hypothetical protein